MHDIGYYELPIYVYGMIEKWLFSFAYTDDEEDDFIVDEQGRPLRRRKGDGTYSEP